MKTQLKLTKITPKHGRLMSVLAGLALLIAASSLTAQVLPPSSQPYGFSYGQWAAQWWQWSLQQSTNQMPPVSGPISGPVRFLAGAASSETATTNITIPAGTSLFFPILSTWVDNSGCPDFTSNTVDELQAEADDEWSSATVTSCLIDGVPVSGLNDPLTTEYFVQATPFSYTTAQTNSVVQSIYGAPCIPGGTTIDPAVADGVFLMLSPLSPGNHTVEFIGVAGPTNDPYVALDLTYQITVPTESRVYPAGGTPYGKSYADWSAAWWQWALSQSSDQTNWVSAPMSGPVEFLAGTPGTDTETRNITVSPGTALFFPILTVWVDNSDCPVFTTNTVAELQSEADGEWSEVTETVCLIDGMPVSGLSNPLTTDYFVQATPFSYTTALTNSVLDTVYGETCIAGGTTIGPAVADGVYMMLAPLAPGNHTIEIVGVVGPTNAPYLAEDLTYQITVQGKSGVYPPGTLPYGKSYADWLAAWWQWALSQSTNKVEWVSAPIAGPVEFLAGAASSTTETRTVTVPAGTPLYVPILNVWADNTGCPTYTTYTVDELQDELAGFWSEVAETTCTIDGVLVAGLGNPQSTGYLTQSLPFSYTTALSNSILDSVYGEPCIPGGTTVSPALAEGVGLMLAPLTAGNHTIEFTAIAGPTNAPFLVFDLTYQITSQPPVLGIARQGGAAEISWPQSGSSYVLEGSTNLNSTNWMPVSASLVATNGLMEATVVAGNSSQFFRLRGQ